MIQQPNQYQCDHIEPGDIVYIKKRSNLYKFYRKYFTSDKEVLKVKKSWESDVKEECYREDCVIFKKHDLRGITSYENEVPCSIYFNNVKYAYKTILKRFMLTAFGLQLEFNNNLVIQVPLNYIESALRANKLSMEAYRNEIQIEEQLKFAKHKGDYFKNYVKDKSITKWNASYCNVCGKPLEFEFLDNIVNIHNCCECNNMSVSTDSLTYDEFAVWYNSQTEDIKKDYYNKFWMEKESI